MTGVAPEDETGHSPHRTPPVGAHLTGGGAGGTDGSTGDSSVLVAYLYSTRVSHSWHVSMMNAIAYDKSVGLNVITAMPFGVFCGGPNGLVEGRNMAVAHFLDKTDHEWLLFVDTDMGFQADAIERLLLAADPVERPIVGGLCFAMKHTVADQHGGFRVMPVPTLFMWAKNPGQGVGFANRFIYPPDTMVQVAGTGAAFILIHRSVLDSIRAQHGDVWFNFVQYGDGVQVSEDLAFCWRAAEVGAPVFVHTGVKITHHKEMWLSERDYSMPNREPMQTMMDAVKGDEPGSKLGHSGSDRWTGGDKKDEA